MRLHIFLELWVYVFGLIVVLFCFEDEDEGKEIGLTFVRCLFVRRSDEGVNKRGGKSKGREAGHSSPLWLVRGSVSNGSTLNFCFWEPTKRVRERPTGVVSEVAGRKEGGGLKGEG